MPARFKPEQYRNNSRQSVPRRRLSSGQFMSRGNRDRALRLAAHQGCAPGLLRSRCQGIARPPGRGASAALCSTLTPSLRIPGHGPSGSVKRSARQAGCRRGHFFDGGGGVPPQGRNINSSPSFKKTVLRIGRHFKRKCYGICNVANPTNRRKPMPRRKRHHEDYFCAGGPGGLSRPPTLPSSHAKPKHGSGVYPKSVAR